MHSRRSIIISYILCFVCLSLLAVGSEAEVKRQKVPVGMFNTYSTRDGNLGGAAPDLREVWEGNPNASDFEACNITRHYWPWPQHLPDVEPGENPYAAWWKDFTGTVILLMLTRFCSFWHNTARRY